MDSYDEFAGVYDLLMDNVPYKEWVHSIINELRTAGIGDGLILELGCGTGTVCELMAEAGYDMTGVDNSPRMLDTANEKKRISGHDILYLLQDMREFELYGTMRAIICICDSINYLTDKSDVLKCFKLVNNYLDPGGLFIFDFNTIHKYRDIIGDAVIAENRDSCSFIWENEFDDEEDINDCLLTIYSRREDGAYERSEEEHVQRGYELSEIKELLSAAGLEYIKAWDGEGDGDISEADRLSRIFVTARECTKKTTADRCE
ncbi:MAG: class I SAM-dependent methyltransferase [Lachnospiraceae bacterium]|nr:class I SAM-dependent methyltransferase [Lachnospiraceae bacterium]